MKAYTYTIPPCPRGEHEITLFPEWSNDEPVVCHYEYVKGEPMTFDHPGSPDGYYLISAYIRGWDCYRMLSHEQVALIEEEIRGRQ